MSNQERSERVKQRRLALGIKSLREFAEATGVSREGVTAAEKGTASAGTYDRIEAWLDKIEHEAGVDEVEAAPVAVAVATPIRFTFHDVFGIGEIIVEGPADKPDELVEAVGKLLEEVRRREG